MNRNALKTTLLLMVLIGFAVVIYISGNSLGPSERAKANAEIEIDISSLKIGEPQFFQIDFTYPFDLFIVLKPSKKQVNDLEKLNVHVWDSNTRSYNQDLNLIVLSGYSTRRGYKLDHYSKNNQIQISQTNKNWLGGYFNWISESSYDYYGRTIKTALHTRNGFNMEVDNLPSPKYKINNKNSITLLLHNED